MTARIQAALAFIPADHRETWVQMGMAVKSELGDAGFDIWDDWSQTAGNYNAASARAVWKSCKGSGVTAGTLFHEARANGWKDDDKQSRPSPELLQARQREIAERLTRGASSGRKRSRTPPRKPAGSCARPCRNSMPTCNPKAGRTPKAPCGGLTKSKTYCASPCA